MLDVLELNIKAKPTSKWAEYIPVHLLDTYEKFDFVGSTFTCSPPPTDTDIDILCLVKEHLSVVGNGLAPLLGAGFHFHEGYDMTDFVSLRKGKVNLILTKDKEFYKSFIRARNVCKLLNIMDKKMRIKVHALIMKEEK